MFKYFNKGYKVVSNVHLNNMKYEPLDYNKVVNCEYKDAVIFIDEVQLVLPSRGAMRKTSIKICDGFLSMCRKQNLELFVTSQAEFKVDIRLRTEADMCYQLTRCALVNGSVQEVHHNYMFDKEQIIVIKIVAIDNHDGREAEFMMNANPFFNMYDSKQVVRVRHLE